MVLFTLAARDLLPVLEFQSTGAASAELAAGNGESHVHLVQLGAGGEIDSHVAGFGQIFFCLEGTGWVASADGVRTPIESAQGAYFARGEVHSKGTASGLRALIVQVDDLHLSSEMASA